MRSPRIILIFILLCIGTALLFVPYADLHEFYFNLGWAPDAHSDAGYSSEMKLLTLKDMAFQNIESIWIIFPLYFPVFILTGSFFSKYINRNLSIVLVILFAIAALLITLITLFLMNFTILDAVNLHWTSYLIIGTEIFFVFSVLLLLTKWFKPLREKMLR